MGRLTWVIKLSKYCNFRCSYCYELPRLANKERIPEDRFDILAKRIFEISSTFGAMPRICWHGGEPLLLPLDYLGRAVDRVNSVYNSETKAISHTVQTNLFIINDKIINFLRENFAVVGVSFDPYGHARKHLNGISYEVKIATNMQLLRDNGVRFGCISVLHKGNSKEIEGAFDFFNEARINFRLLPFYRTSSASQLSRNGNTEKEVVSAMKNLFDLWFSKNKGISIQPLDLYMEIAIAKATGKVKPKYSKMKGERVYIVDTSGDIYSIADTYNESYRHGNIFYNSGKEITDSVGRNACIEEAEQRMDAMCLGCEYSSACSGWYAAEATDVEREMHKGLPFCPVAHDVIDYIYRRITSTSPHLLQGAEREPDNETKDLKDTWQL